MGSCAESPVKVTDLILNMIDKAARQDAAFLVDLAALQVRPAGSSWAAAAVGCVGVARKGTKVLLGKGIGSPFLALAASSWAAAGSRQGRVGIVGRRERMRRFLLWQQQVRQAAAAGCVGAVGKGDRFHCFVLWQQQLGCCRKQAGACWR
jgi:hypothetical protein